MAQLTDDCFAFDGPLITAAEALMRITETLVTVVALEEIPIDAALGRVLARDIVAPRAIPPYDNSAVDGYAVYFEDLQQATETTLPVIGRVAAGHPLQGPQKHGEASLIFTGAPMPPGPDTVMMVEDCTLSADGTTVTLKPGIKQGANCRLAGDDVDSGTTVLRAGIQLRPPEIGMLAACGLATVPVFERLSVALFSTGDEVREPGGALPDGAIFDSNRFTIRAALQSMGVAVEDLGILPDDAEAIRSVLVSAAERHPAILSTGGMSMGEEDHVRGVVDQLGSLSFWRVAIKPGRPVGMGLVRRADGSHSAVIGLPGNPVAALTTFVTLARPVLLKMSGQVMTDVCRYRVCADFDYKKKTGRREFVRARMDGRDAATGLPRVVKHGRSGAGVLSSLVGADGFVELPEDDTYLEAGSMVDFLPFAEVFR